MFAEHPDYGKGIKVKLSIKVGDTYAIPLKNKTYGICRVINSSSTKSEKFQGFLGFSAPLITASHFTFEKLPSISDISPDKNLYMENLARQIKSNDPQKHLIKFYVHEKPPKNFIYLGNIKPTDTEADLPALCIGDWNDFKNQWKI